VILISRKSYGRKVKISKAKFSRKPAPRWVDLRVFGLKRARFKSVKRFASRHWRKRGKLKV